MVLVRPVHEADANVRAPWVYGPELDRCEKGTELGVRREPIKRHQAHRRLHNDAVVVRTVEHEDVHFLALGNRGGDACTVDHRCGGARGVHRRGHDVRHRLSGGEVGRVHVPRHRAVELPQTALAHDGVHRGAVLLLVHAIVVVSHDHLIVAVVEPRGIVVVRVAVLVAVVRPRALRKVLHP